MTHACWQRIGICAHKMMITNISPVHTYKNSLIYDKTESIIISDKYV